MSPDQNNALLIDDWLEAVQNIRRGGLQGGGKSPYKPLLLAAVLIRIAQGKLLRPEVRLDATTRALYRQLRAEAFPEWPYRDDFRQPFARLVSEVWELQPDGRYERELIKLLGAGAGASWQAIARATECAVLPTAVHASLCTSSTTRSRLGKILVGQLTESKADPAGLQRIAQRLSVTAQVDQELQVEDLEENLLESAIEEHIVANWQETPFAAEGVKLFCNARDEVIGRQYPIGGWSIDLLGWQERQRCWWIIELKRGRASDRVVGQVGRYLGWVDRYMTRPRERTRGVILARSISTRLRHACYPFPQIDAWTFNDDLRVQRPEAVSGE